jgi:hypothetical protein
MVASTGVAIEFKKSRAAESAMNMAGDFCDMETTSSRCSVTALIAFDKLWASS